VPSTFGNWGTCTKSCTPMVGELMDTKGVSGTQYHTAQPVAAGNAADGSCKLGDATAIAAWVTATGEASGTTRCDMAWGGGKECSAFPDWVGDANVLGGEYYKQTRDCNTQACPVDCVASPWQPWSACTATCGGGTSTRTRSVKIAEKYGGKPCVNACEASRPSCTKSGLHTQTSACNDGVSCSKFDLPTCQLEHVHCEIKSHNLHADKKTWMSSIDSKGVRYYHNAVTGQNTYSRPSNYVECAAPMPLRWEAKAVTKRTLGTKAHEISPYQTHGRNTITHYREGDFVPHVTHTCLNNQNCGMVDLGACHGCDTEQECKDMGMSSTLFVTHHRKFMHQQKYNPTTGKHDQAQYHCKREGATGCKCTCDGHTPCVVRQGKLLSNAMLHANSYQNVPVQQDCCNMCTNHPQCGSWEYSSTKVCVLKTGAPQFVDAPSSSSVMVWSGCRAGETC